MNQSKRLSKTRKGTVLVGTLACLGIVIAMVMFTVQASLRGRKQARQHRQLLQTELLCEAGVKRAVQQFAKSATYRGEKWTPTLRGTPFEFAMVDIRLEPASDASNVLRAKIVASLASTTDSIDRMQRSHSFEINASNKSTESNP